MKEKKSVLIIEDDELYRDFLSKYFAKKSFKVTAVQNGLEGFNEVEKQEFDLIVTDIRMPVMDGLEFLKRLKDSNKRSRVIVLTAYGEMDSYVKTLNWGVLDYLHKPVDVNELSAVVEKILTR